MVSLVVVACCSGTFLCGSRTLLDSAAASGEGADWADKALPAIGKEWNAAEVVERESPIVDFDPVERRKWLEIFSRKLGSYKSHEPFKVLNWQARSTTTTGSYLAVNVQTTAQFDKGEATVTFALAKKDGAWGMVRMQINSDLLVQ